MALISVRSGGLHLAVAETGPADAPVVVLVHGFPDCREVWNRVVPLLADRFRVVTYDVRGAGRSDAPAARSGYHLDHLVDDLAAVVEATAPDRQVHLVGHDWGSVQLWDAVLREADHPVLRGRIASFTSISGPALELIGRFLLSGLKRRQLLSIARQAAHSWYIGAFQLPLLPELAFARFGDQLRGILARGQRLADPHWTDSFADDGRRGVNLYRTNRLRFATPSTQVPVQLIVPTKDAFLTPAIYAEVEALAPNLRRIDLVADHWVVQAQPEIIADTVTSWIVDVEARAAA